MTRQPTSPERGTTVLIATMKEAINQVLRFINEDNLDAERKRADGLNALMELEARLSEGDHVTGHSAQSGQTVRDAPSENRADEPKVSDPETVSLPIWQEDEDHGDIAQAVEASATGTTLIGCAGTAEMSGTKLSTGSFVPPETFLFNLVADTQQLGSKLETTYLQIQRELRLLREELEREAWNREQAETLLNEVRADNDALREALRAAPCTCADDTCARCEELRWTGS